MWPTLWRKIPSCLVLCGSLLWFTAYPLPRRVPRRNGPSFPIRHLWGTYFYPGKRREREGAGLRKEGEGGEGRGFFPAFWKCDALQRPQASTAWLTEGVPGNLGDKEGQSLEQTRNTRPSGGRERAQPGGTGWWDRMDGPSSRGVSGNKVQSDDCRYFVSHTL